MREAEGQVETKRSEITEKVFDSNRKAVAAKDVATTIEQWQGEIREYTNLTGFGVENHQKMLNLKRMLPKTIKDMLQTIELTDYKEAKEHVLKQARALKNEREPKPATIDLNENEEETRKVTFEEPLAQEDLQHRRMVVLDGQGTRKGK